ncbi:gamma-aminobutyric acid receptor subunit gamma-2 [Platysternon megacephalum]|uniref:Gamma-aminobutyric acid receptor subunit gamma-2 n=1 Tax=Platysternon megacephalum TaxID=55544 RepID=A0A4D9EWN6_9SAUR|nr:gamma-aminobutyric acid receptor subunit gamma-2 [Platysternon megacephalum]
MPLVMHMRLPKISMGFHCTNILAQALDLNIFPTSHLGAILKCIFNSSIFYRTIFSASACNEYKLPGGYGFEMRNGENVGKEEYINKREYIPFPNPKSYSRSSFIDNIFLDFKLGSFAKGKHLRKYFAYQIH